MNDRVFRTYRIAVRLAAVFVAAAVVFFLAARVFVPGGYLSVTTDLVHPAPFVAAAKPSERLAQPIIEKGRPLTPVIGDPIYFDLMPPSRFDSITMRVQMANGGQPLVELGALGSSLDEQYELRPAQNALLDTIGWGRISSGSLALYQRTHRYASVDEFLAHPPERSKVAVYQATAPIPYRIPAYAPSAATRTIDVSLRGNHRLLTYIKDETLHFTFIVQDMNRQIGADPVTVSVYRDGSDEAVSRTVLEDDGNISTDQRSSSLRTVAVTLAGAMEGVYKIEFTSPPDVFIRKIVTPERKLVFADRIYIGDHVGFSPDLPKRTVVMDGRRLTARTAHAEGMQTLTVGGEKLGLDEPLTKYIRTLQGSGLTSVTAPKGDVLLETDGMFALSRDDYFDPLPLTLEWYTAAVDLDKRRIDFVLTSYEPPGNDGDLRVAEATFPVSTLDRTKEGAFRFIFSVPGIEETQAEIRLASVTFIMRRDKSTWSEAWTYFTSRFSGKKGRVAPVVSNGRSYGESPQ